jgi:hypothetical membrane protein
VRRPRSLAWGGVAGPVAFIGTWATLGATRDGYDPIRTAISRLAERGASTAAPMTAGFLTFGIAVPVAASALREHVRGPSWLPAIVTGLATIGVAATPLGTSERIDLLHGAAATTGYVSLACIPVVMLPALDSGRLRRAAWLTSGACAAALAATLIGTAHGLFQRTGIVIGDAWLATACIGVAVGRGPLRGLRQPSA